DNELGCHGRREVRFETDAVEYLVGTGDVDFRAFDSLFDRGLNVRGGRLTLLGVHLHDTGFDSPGGCGFGNAAPHRPRANDGQLIYRHGLPPRTSRYSATTVCKPMNSARLMRAWPIDTSSRCGSVRKRTRFSRSRSCPAFTPRSSS